MSQKSEESSSLPTWKYNADKAVDNIYFFNEEDPLERRAANNRTRLTHAASQEFIDAVREDISNGYGFVPFIGAGFSVTAGIPIIAHLQSYLQRCICMSLGISGTDQNDVPRWNPRTDNWPPFIDRSRVYPTGYWEGLVRRRYARELRKERSKDAVKRKDANPWIFQLALGMMSEWRSSLDFLSRVSVSALRTDISKSSRASVHFCEPDRAIVDACFREVMRNKHSSMNHQMLAALSSVLRIDLVLTTNFDNLTEKAFDEHRSPLTAFDVHMKDSLPDFAAVSRARSIIKLHGSLRSLRADFSLDGPPTYEDRKIFCEYLAGRISLAEYKKGQFSVKNHLLVMGVAASEQRTIEFITEALDKIPDLNLYWVCFSSREVASVHKAFKGFVTADSNLRPRVRVLRHTNVGLLFLHLYQFLRKSLPTNGALFPSTTRLAVPPLVNADKHFDSDQHYVALRQELYDVLSPDERPAGTSRPRLITMSADTGVYGVACAAAEVFRVLEARNNCLWIDMNDIHSVDDLFEAFQESAFRHLGETDWTPLYKINRRYADKGNGKQGEWSREQVGNEIVRIINSSNQPWYLFINARETPGTNRTAAQLPNGWMDDGWTSRDVDPKSDRYRSSVEGFCDLIRSFLDANEVSDANQICVILICSRTSSNGPAARSKNSVLEQEMERRFGNKSGVSRLEPLHATIPPQEKTRGKLAKRDQGPRRPPERTVIENVIRWACHLDAHEDLPNLVLDERELDALRLRRRQARRRFVQTLVSMQRPRHLSIIWSRSMNGEWVLSSEFDHLRMDWVEALEIKGLLLRMDGGFIWFQASFRQALRRCLSLTSDDLDRDQPHLETKCGFGLSDDVIEYLKDWNATAYQASIHLALSTWCRKIFDSTGVSPAVFEIAEHLCHSSHCLLQYEGSIQDGAGTLRASQRVRVAGDRLQTARHLLREHLFLIQTQGHSGATLRRLSALKTLVGTMKNLATSLYLQRIIVEFRRTIAEICRAICREIAEDGDAFEHLLEVKDEIRNLAALEAPGAVGKPSTVQSKAVGDALHLISTSANGSQLEVRYQWIRWWRWCSMLGNQSRSFMEAARSCRRALDAAKTTDEDSLYEFKRVAGDLNADGLKGWQLSTSGDYRMQLETLHTLEVTAFNMTLRAHTLARRLAMARNEITKPNKKALPQDAGTVASLNSTAWEYVVKGLEFVEQIQNDGNTETNEHDFELHWIKARLLMLAGIAALTRPGLKYTSRHAMSFISDAAACLNSATPDRARGDLAIVELRRSEVRLNEASGEKLYTFRTAGTDEAEMPFCQVPFETWTYDRLYGNGLSEEVEWMRNAERPEFRSQLDLLMRMKLNLSEGGRAARNLEGNLRRIRARVTDALRFLDRAEPILRERRRNVFWTTWYIERRLRAIALILWTSVFDTKRPIPYLGLEAAMFGSPSEADGLLIDAQRMIRVDSYRMALVVLSYASCARALQVRLQLEGEQQLTANLLFRLVDMRNKLVQASDQLKATIESRNRFGGHLSGASKKTRRKAEVDEDVTAVIDMCLKRIENVTKGLEVFSNSPKRGVTPHHVSKRPR